MKLIYYSGNLGNQIFQCAFKDYIEKKYPHEKVYYHRTKYCPPILVERCFDLSMPKHSFILGIIASLVFYSNLLLLRLFHIKLPQKLICSSGEITEYSFFFSNYLQDKYFYECKDSSWLKVRMPSVCSESYKSFEREIIESDSICVHIRRGDYVKPGSLYADLCSSDYYENAITLAKEKCPSGRLFFFSDDLKYVKDRFKDEDACFVNCNRGELSYLDMKLMSLAKINIMANSTFSYWGAYMGHEKKIVIYPKKWFTELSGRVAPDIMLDRENWIGL